MSGTNTLSTLVWNERTKLLANALDRASTAVAAGGIFPLVNAWRANQAAGAGRDFWFFAASGYIFIFVAVMPHFAARHVLKVLK
jgi:hypothetical protein